MDNASFDQEENQNQQQGFTLDFKRVLSRALRFWYVILISLVAALTIAFYKNRYTQRVYPISASIVILEAKEMSGAADILFKNSLIEPYRNYLNEPYIIRSYPLIEKVIVEQSFHVAFYRDGYFMTTEAYDYMPVIASWCNPDEIKEGSFLFKLVDKNHYSLAPYSKGDGAPATVFAIDDSIQFDDYKLCIRKNPDNKMESYIGVPFLLVIRNPSAIASAYVNKLQVEWAELGSGVLNLSLTGTNVRKEHDFLESLIDSYQARDLEKKNETARRTINFIQNQLTDIKDSLRTVEFQLERFGNSSRVKDMSEDAQRYLTRLEEFESQKSELLIRENYYQYIKEYLHKGDTNLDQIVLPTSIGLMDPVLGSLLNKMVDLQLEMKLYMDPARERNPLVASKVESIREIKQNVLESVETLKSTDKIKLDFLNKQLRQIEKQLQLLPASERQLISVQRNYSLLENLYVFLMQKLSEASISEASSTSDILVVNPPMAGGAISPKPTQNYAIAGIVGLAIPLLIFVLFEIINNRVQSKEDIDKMTSIPFLGGVGHSDGNNLAVKEKTRSAVAESFRALRSNLSFFTGNKTRQIFMVSSSISGEGKTFTTINLATVFALSGKKTLIVGADMRRPKIFEDFGRANQLGLSTYLSGLSEFKDVVQDTEIENLYFISGGPVPPNPSELLLTDRFEAFIKNASEQFDYIIIDTPPLALVTDAFVISKFVDHTVFVLRQNYSPKAFIRSIDEFYKSGKLVNMSIILNDIYKSGLGYGYGQEYAYHYGYGYGIKKRGGNGYYE